jgi:large subunit ribosomal protein L3
MTLALMGKKCGMTRIFTEKGESIPVTVLEVTPNCITQIKKEEIENYSAVQIAYGDELATNKVKKPLMGHFKKAGVAARRFLHECRIDAKQMESMKIGDMLTVERFKVGQAVDVQGLTKGRGFSGVVKRHNFRTQDASHGNSLSHRAPGSIGQCQTPGRVIKGKKMAGQMGNVLRTIHNQKIVKIDKDKNLIFIKGAIPGAPAGWVLVKQCVKIRKEV